MRCSIKWVLISGVIGLLVLSVSIILASSYLTSQRVLRQHAQVIMQTIATFTINEAQTYLAPARNAAELTEKLMRDEVLRLVHPSEIEHYFYDQLSQMPHVAGIYLGHPSGEFLYVSRNNEKTPGGFSTKIRRFEHGEKVTELIWKDASQQEVMREYDHDDDFDPTTRPWYVQAVEEGRTIWTEPYVFFTAEVLGVTVSSPVRDADGTLITVVGVDIEIDSISAFLSELEIGQQGRAFIIDRTGRVIAFPDLAILKSSSHGADGQWRPAKIDHFDDELSRKSFAALQALGKPLEVEMPCFADFVLQNQNYHVMFAPFTDPQWPWILGIYMPEADYLGAIKRNRSFNIAIMLGIAAVGSLIGWGVVRSIVKPMSALQVEAHRINQDDLGDNLDTHSFIKEIQDTTDAFVQMKAGLVDFRERTLNLTQDLQAQTDGLRRSEARYRTLVEGSIQGILILDAADHCVFANSALAQVLGYEKAEDLLGRSLSDHITPQDYVRIQRFREARERGELSPHRYELQGIRKDGSLCWLAARFSPVEWEGQLARMSTVVDISERKKLEQELIQLSEEEQRRLGQELHDGLGQLLTGTSLMSRMLAEDLAAQNRPEADDAAQVADWVHQALNAAHNVAQGLYPEALANQGLGRALESLGIQAERLLGLDCEVEGEVPDGLIAPSDALHLYRIAQEALTNAAKHGHATAAILAVNVTSECLHLAIRDNGSGFPEDVSLNGGMGLRNMRTRAATLEAAFTIQRLPQGGTEVGCTMPLDSATRI